MFLPRVLLDEFWAYVRVQLGIDPIIHANQDNDSEELGRFVMGERLVVVRTFGGTKEGQQIEVFMSNPDALHTLDQGWSNYFLSLHTELEGILEPEKKDAD